MAYGALDIWNRSLYFLDCILPNHIGKSFHILLAYKPCLGNSQVNISRFSDLFLSFSQTTHSWILAICTWISSIASNLLIDIDLGKFYNGLKSQEWKVMVMRMKSAPPFSSNKHRTGMVSQLQSRSTSKYWRVNCHSQQLEEDVPYYSSCSIPNPLN